MSSSWMANRADTSEIIDLDAICSRPSRTPARDMTPPDLRSMGAFTTDLVGAADDTIGPRGVRARAGASPKKKLAIVGVASALLAVIAIVTIVTVRHGDASAASTRQPQSSVAAKMPPATTPPAETAAAPEPPKTAAAVVAPPASNIKLPPPPTTGAPSVANAPPRAFRAAAPKPAAPAGPKMTKVQSTGVAAR